MYAVVGYENSFLLCKSEPLHLVTATPETRFYGEADRTRSFAEATNLLDLSTGGLVCANRGTVWPS